MAIDHKPRRRHRRGSPRRGARQAAGRRRRRSGPAGRRHVPGPVRRAVRPVLPAADRVRDLREPAQGARLGSRPRAQFHHDGVRRLVQLRQGLLRPVVPARCGPGPAVRSGPDPGDAGLRHRPGPAGGLGGGPLPALLPACLLPALRHPRGHRRDSLVLPLPAWPQPHRGHAAARRLRHGELPRQQQHAVVHRQHRHVGVHGLQHAHHLRGLAGHPGRPVRGRTP